MIENTDEGQVALNSQSSASLRYWKWRILLATMACYLFFYCGRFNLAICLKPIMNEFGWDKAQMGFLVSVLIISYGIGQFINGNLTDRFGRVLMPLGAIISCLANWAFSYASEFSGWFAVDRFRFRHLLMRSIYFI